MRAPVSLAMLAFRRWWPVILCTVGIGVALGAWTGSNAPYSATTVLQVDVSGTDQTGNAQTLQTALQFVDTSAVYKSASASTQTNPDDLRTRTKVALHASAPLVMVTVTAPTAAEAEAQSKAVSQAAVVNLQTMSDEQFAQARATGAHAVDDGMVNDPPAEQARRQAIGMSIATQQRAALSTASLLTPLGNTQPAERAGLTGTTAIAIGVLAGLLIGALLAVAVNRRGRIRKVVDVRLAGPDIRCYEQGEAISRLASTCVAGDSPLVAVLAMKGVEQAADEMAYELHCELQGEGMETLTVQSADVDLARRPSDAGDRPRNPVPALAQPKRAKDLVAAGADVMVYQGFADGVDIARVNSRAEAILLVVAGGTTRVGELRRIHSRLADGGSVPIVVIARAG